jgi:hypothetical protein
MQLVGRIPNSEPDRDAVLMQVRTFKEKAETVLETLDAAPNNVDRAHVDDTSVAKLFEEVKVMFQDLPSRIEGRLDPARHRKSRRFHPGMIEEFLHVSGDFGDPTGLLFLIGLLREELPWLHELGLEFYRAIKSGNRAQIRKTMKPLMIALDFTRYGPFIDEMPDKDSYLIVRELPDIFERYFARAMEKSEKRSRNAVKKSGKRSASAK